jgi:hypothetical protein
MGERNTIMRFSLILTALVAVAATLPATAQTPAPRVSNALGMHRVPVKNLLNAPNGTSNTHSMSGQGCISGPTAVRAQNSLNPITGKPQAATIVSIPLGKGSGDIASATTRSQQAQACAHSRAH